MAERGTRSLASYNEAVLAEVEANKPMGRVYHSPQLSPAAAAARTGANCGDGGELADLMMVASKESEDYITLLTQKPVRQGYTLFWRHTTLRWM